MSLVLLKRAVIVNQVVSSMREGVYLCSLLCPQHLPRARNELTSQGVSTE